MTQKNRETMQRAVGIIEGAMYGASERVQDALILATELIDSVMDSEVKTEMQAQIKANTLLAEYGEEQAEGRIDAYQYAIIYLNEITKKYIDGKVNSNEEKYFSPEDVRNMTPQEVREKYTAIRRSMERW